LKYKSKKHRAKQSFQETKISLTRIHSLIMRGGLEATEERFT